MVVSLVIRGKEHGWRGKAIWTFGLFPFPFNNPLPPKLVSTTIYQNEWLLRGLIKEVGIPALWR